MDNQTEGTKVNTPPNYHYAINISLNREIRQYDAFLHFHANIKLMELIPKVTKSLTHYIIIMCPEQA